jgi:hypothetical protein
MKFWDANFKYHVNNLYPMMSFQNNSYDVGGFVSHVQLVHLPHQLPHWVMHYSQ